MIHDIVFAASVLMLCSVEASRPETFGGDIRVAVEPKNFQRAPSKSVASSSSQRVGGPETASSRTAEAHAVPVTAEKHHEEPGGTVVTADTHAAASSLSAAGHQVEHAAGTFESHPSHAEEKESGDDGDVHELKLRLAEMTNVPGAHDALGGMHPSNAPISQHRPPIGTKNLTKIHVVAITNRPKDGRVAVLKQSLITGGFSSDEFHYTTTEGYTTAFWGERLEIEQKIVQDAARIDPEAVYLFVDAFDVFTLGSPEEMLGKFQQTGRDALFSCVTYPYPHQCKGFDWKEDGRCNKASNWGAECSHWCRFACAGAFMGKAGALAQIFAENPPDAISDDQCYFNTVFAKRSYNIAIDYRHEVFFSTADMLQCSLERKAGRLLVTSTGTLPSVIHFDATHPTAEHLSSFWLDTLQNQSGRLCASKSSCTDWCWDWDFGDMPARITASDEKLLFKALHWNPGKLEYVVVRADSGLAVVIGVILGVLAVLLLAVIIYCCMHWDTATSYFRSVWDKTTLSEGQKQEHFPVVENSKKQTRK